MVQIGFVVRYLVDRESAAEALPESNPPTTHIRLAKEMFLHMLLYQINGDASQIPPGVRTGSVWAWYHARYVLNLTSNYAYAHTNDSTPPVDPHNERFPEFVPRGGNVYVDDAMRVARCELLQCMKFSIFRDQDEGRSLLETVENLWTFYLHELWNNAYLRGYCGSEEIFQQLQVLSAEEQSTLHAGMRWDSAAYTAWLDRLDTTTGEPTGDASQQAMLSYEISHCFKVYTSCADDAHLSAEQLGDHESHLLKSWYHHVQSWQELEGKEESCPVCLDNYAIPFEATMVTVKLADSSLTKDGHCCPVQLKCNHILCLACLKSWSQGPTRLQNYNKCPLCRTHLQPPNAQLTNILSLHDLSLPPTITSTTTATATTATATHLLNRLSTYLYNLPHLLSQYPPSHHYPFIDSRLAYQHSITLLHPTSRLRTHIAASVTTPCLHARQDTTCPALIAMINERSFRGLFALELLRLARARLAAFVRGDREAYRVVRRRGVQADAEYGRVLYRSVFGDVVDAWAREGVRA